MIPVLFLDKKWVFDGYGNIDTYWTKQKIIPPFLCNSDEVWIEEVNNEDVELLFTENYHSITFALFKEMKKKGLIIDYTEVMDFPLSLDELPY